MSNSNFCYKLGKQKENNTGTSGSTPTSKWKLDPQEEWMQENSVNDCVEGTGVFLWSLQLRKNLPMLGQILGQPEIVGIWQICAKETVTVWFHQPSNHRQSACTLCLFPTSLASVKDVKIHCHILSWASEKRDSTAKHCHRPAAVHSLGMNFCSLPPNDWCSVLSF